MRVFLSPNEDDHLGDAMNAYLDEEGKLDNVEQTYTDTSVLEFIEVAAVPKTPLHRTIVDFHKRSRQANGASSPQLENPAINIFTQENLNTLA